jgi:hypothetical protein
MPGALRFRSALEQGMARGAFRKTERDCYAPVG